MVGLEFFFGSGELRAENDRLQRTIEEMASNITKQINYSSGLEKRNDELEEIFLEQDKEIEKLKAELGQKEGELEEAKKKLKDLCYSIDKMPGGWVVNDIWVVGFSADEIEAIREEARS